MSRVRSLTIARTALLTFAIGAALGGCGRRGRLEPPPTPESIAAAEKDKDTKSGIQKRPPNPPIRVPTRPFVLDPIL